MRVAKDARTQYRDGVDWWGYVQRISDGATGAAIAKAVGIAQSSVTRWQTGGVRPQHAAEFARHYGRPVLEAFLAAGFLTPDEAKVRPVAQPDLGSLSDEQVLDLVRSRMRRGSADDTATTQAGGSPATSPEWGRLAADRGESRGRALRRAQDEAAEEGMT